MIETNLAYAGETDDELARRRERFAEAHAAKAELVALVKEERRAKWKQLRALEAFEAKGYHLVLGVGIDELAAEVGIARSRRDAREVRNLGKYLVGKPLARAAFDAGDVDPTKLRIAGPQLAEDEVTWLEHMKKDTVRELTNRVRAVKGEKPVRTLQVQLPADVFAIWDQIRDAMCRSEDRDVGMVEVLTSAAMALRGLALPGVDTTALYLNLDRAEIRRSLILHHPRERLDVGDE